MKKHILLVSLGWMVWACTVAEPAERPNVIIILADDLGFSDLGCYGGEISTPNLDRMATRGVRFSSFYTSARCCPSRAALMTGLHPHQAGIGSFVEARPVAGKGPAYAGRLLSSCVTLAELLGDAGYSTWMVGKWHLGDPGPMARGFQEYYGYRNFSAYAEDQWDASKYVRLPAGRAPEIRLEEGTEFYATDVFSRYAVEFLRQAHRQDRPFFLYLAHSSPHFPVQAPKATIDRYMEMYLRGWDVLRGERFERQKAMGLFSKEADLPPRSMVPVDQDSIANGYPGQTNPPWADLPEARRIDLARRMAIFAAMVEHVDTGVGTLLAELESSGADQNTLIFFLSDNGACYEWGPFGFDGPSRQGLTRLHVGADLEQMGLKGSHHAYGSGWANLCNTPLSMYKHFCHEGGIASPLIVQAPGPLNLSGGIVEEPAHLMDIVPTVLEAAGVTYPATRAGRSIQPLEGVSLIPAMGGEVLPERVLAFEHQAARGLRKGRWKITWGKREGRDPTWRLYDLDDDRFEQIDLLPTHPEIGHGLIALWEDWARRVGAEPFFLPDSDAY